MTALRPIAALDLPDIVPQAPPTSVPELTMIDPRDVSIDGSYQRNLSERSLDLIGRIVSGFDWRKWRPPVCAWTDDGLTAIDGQHSLIAAASNPHITQVPVLIVEALTIEERAEVFINVNRDRLAVTKRQLHHAAVVAGDTAAVATQDLCDRLNIKLLKSAPNSRAKYEPRDCCAVSQITDMIARIGIELAEIVLRSLCDAECAPIKEVHIKAAEHLLVDPEFSGQIAPAELTATIAALGEAGEKEGRIFSATHGVPQWRGLASVWFSKRKKSRPAPRIAQFDAVEGKFEHGFRSVLPAARVIEARRSVPFGEPEPGRSALDQRRAAS